MVAELVDPSAEAAARPLRTPLRALAFAEPALQGTDKNGLILLVLIVLVPSLLASQFPRSQHGTVTQHIQGTEVSISYNRPVAASCSATSCRGAGAGIPGPTRPRRSHSART